jgi:hypothetical protein
VKIDLSLGKMSNVSLSASSVHMPAPNAKKVPLWVSASTPMCGNLREIVEFQIWLACRKLVITISRSHVGGGANHEAVELVVFADTIELCCYNQDTQCAF